MANSSSSSSSSLLSRMWRAAQIARTVLSWSAAQRWLPPPPPSAAPAASPPRQLAYERQQSLLDCMPDASPPPSPGAASSFSTATTASVCSRASSPSSFSSSSSPSPSSGGGGGGSDVDRRADEFIKNFRRSISLELRYCGAAASCGTAAAAAESPVKSPVSPETYFNLMGLQTIYAAPVSPPASRGSSPRPVPSSWGVKWHSSKDLGSSRTSVV